MRALLDTNILIHREAAVVVRLDIGALFHWLDRLGIEKWVHPGSIAEIERPGDQRVRASFKAKLASYRVIQMPSPIAADVARLGAEVDVTDNDRQDTALLSELYAGRVDVLLTEDRGIGRKAARLGLADKVFTIDAFLEKVTAEHPDLIDYRVLSVRKTPFARVRLNDPFFDSFRAEYPEFDRWFRRKNDEPAYVSLEGEKLVAFVYLKVEDEREPYGDIKPPFSSGKASAATWFSTRAGGVPRA